MRIKSAAFAVSALLAIGLLGCVPPPTPTAPGSSAALAVLHFELGPDNIATGGSGHTTTIRVTVDGYRHWTFTSSPEAGNDGVREWTPFAVELGVEPPWTEHEITFEWTSGRDAMHLRRVHIKQGANTDYGRFGRTGSPYSALHQDGPGWVDLHTFHDQMAGDGATGPQDTVQLNPATGRNVQVETPRWSFGPVELVMNGDFESPQHAYTGSISSGIAGWTIGGSTVDFASVFEGPVGLQAVDLNGQGAASVSQSIATVPGKEYDLSFHHGGTPSVNSSNGCGPGPRPLGVYWDQSPPFNPSRVLDFNVEGPVGSDRATFVEQRLRFRATSTQTYLGFQSLRSGHCGPVIDGISVKLATSAPACFPVGSAGLPPRNTPICSSSPPASGTPLVPTAVVSDRSYLVTDTGTNRLICRAWFQAPARSATTRYGIAFLNSLGQEVGTYDTGTLGPGGPSLIRYDDPECTGWKQRLTAVSWYPFALDAQGQRFRPGRVGNWSAPMTVDPGEPTDGFGGQTPIPDRALVLAGPGVGESVESCLAGSPTVTNMVIDSDESPIYAVGKPSSAGGGYDLEYEVNTTSRGMIRAASALDILGLVSVNSAKLGVFTRVQQIPVCVGGYRTLTAWAYDRPATYTFERWWIGPFMFTATDNPQYGNTLDPGDSTLLLPRHLYRFDYPHPLTEAIFAGG